MRSTYDITDAGVKPQATAAELEGTQTQAAVISNDAKRRSTETDSWTTSGGTSAPPPMKPISRRAPSGRVDRALLDRATELLGDVENLAPDELLLTLEALRCAVSELWTTTLAATQYHQSILAIIESFLLTRDELDANQAAALRGAIKDLALSNIGEQHVEVIRSQFIDAGYQPLAFLSDLEVDRD